jgi:hypothetical protein
VLLSAYPDDARLGGFDVLAARRHESSAGKNKDERTIHDDLNEWHLGVDTLQPCAFQGIGKKDSCPGGERRKGECGAGAGDLPGPSGA